MPPPAGCPTHSVESHPVPDILLPEPIERVWLSEQTLRRRVKELAAEIDQEYDDSHPPRLITILKGGVFFMTDLSRALTVPHTLDYLSILPYAAQDRSGEARIVKDLDDPIEGVRVLLVEDVIDTGLTLSYICRNLERRGPLDLKVCSLLDRPQRRLVDAPVHFKGFDAPDDFLVGYGLDWRQQYRSLPYIGLLKRSMVK